MADNTRVVLFGKLNPTAFKALESATVSCKKRGNAYVELLHWIDKLVGLQDSDIHRILDVFDVDLSRVAADVTSALDALPRGATSISDMSAHIEEAAETAWVWASLTFGQSSIRTGHLLVGIVKSPGLRNVLFNASAEFHKIRPDTLVDDFDAIVEGSPEANAAATQTTAMPGEASAAVGGPGGDQGLALAQFTVDMTELASAEDADPIVGRDDEIRQLVDILMRRRQNNPILTGEAGVGKTAVVEGFAQRIVRGDVPPPLQGVKLLSLDIGLLQAGASMKGEFENRLRQVIDEVQSSPTPIISVHRRGAHARRSRGCSRHRRCRQPFEACAGARHLENRGGHDVGRVQETHRERPGVDSTFPGRADR